MPSRREFLSLSAFSAAWVGCGKPGDGRPVVGVVPKGTNHIFWQTIHAGARKAGSEYGMEILWNAPQLEIDASRQIAIVENLIARRVQGIVLAPVDEEALVGVVERASGQGIPVSIFDSGIKTDKILSFVATDNYQAGRMGARRMGEILQGKGKVGVIGFMPGSASTMQREQGFLDEMKESFGGIEVLGVRFNMADRAKALAEAENLMTAHPDLAGLFADNESSTDGTVRAVQQRGANVKVVGFDASEELLAAMKAGKIDSIVVQDPFKMGYLATKAVGEQLAGRTPDRQIDSGAYLITPENVDTPEMQAVLHPGIAAWLEGGQ
ncbi:MAG: substrate-binding domain-containing protein [Acidobacteria bacterium]|nr:substrate-binding domain-containing protein [Acidobacteriota bacterium]